MIPIAFEYERPDTLEQALALKQQASGDARFIAGGHSLIPLMKLRLIEPELLIDISRIPGLSGVDAPGGRISICVLPTHAEPRSRPSLLRRPPVGAWSAGGPGRPQGRRPRPLCRSLGSGRPALAHRLPAPVTAPLPPLPPLRPHPSGALPLAPTDSPSAFAHRRRCLRR